MYFKRLDIQGFKSFAEPVSIEFNNGITCIVGPNGSGKSNISDAIRWVLGEQSPKALRGGKMDEVIFAGTANRKSRGMAEVTLIIDNSSKILPIDYNEVAITRRMYRSGESEYLINNNHCRLKDIREMIMDTGIGVDGYSLIGQGKIADIVANKTESRREIFEEAAGIVMYRTKKAESERKLALSKQNLERVNDIVSEIEGRIDGLKEDSIKASEYISLREKYKEHEINITLKNIENIELKNEYLKDDISEAVAEIEELRESKVEIDKAVAENRQRAESLEEIYSDANKKLLAAVEEINQLTNQSEINKERLTAISQNTERLTEEISQISDKLEKEEKNADELKKTKAEIDTRLAKLDTELREKIENHSKAVAENTEKAANVDAMKNEIFNLHNKIAGKNAEITSLENLKTTLDRRKDVINEEASSKDEENEAVIKAKARASEEKAELEKEIARLKDSSTKAKQSYNEMLLKEKQEARTLEECRLSIGQVSARKKTIEEMESNYEGYNGAVKFIMKSGFFGIHGVVAELLTVPAGYEVAIETALGAAMQNIVCADDQSAQNAINALKENRAGRLTFLPLSSIKGRGNRDSEKLSGDGFIGFGIDCIKFDPKYRNIFDYLLGRVAVVDNMKNAVALSRKNTTGLRFVTLEGEIINAGGAITGGKYKNNTANLLERKAEITTLGEKLEKLLSTRDKSQKTLDEIKAELEKTRLDIEEMSSRNRELEIQLLTKTNQLEVIESVLSDNIKGKEKFEAELSNIEIEKNSATDMIAKLGQEIVSSREEIEKLEKEAEELLALFENSKQDIEVLSELITKARIDVTACEGEKSAVDAMVARIEGDIEILVADRDTKKAQIEALASQREQLTGGSMGALASLHDKERKKADLERYIQEVVEEKASVTAGLNADAAQKDEIDEKLTALQNTKFELEIKQGKNETQLENYKEKLWSEFEVTYIQAIEFKKRDFNMNIAVREAREIKARMKELGEVNIGAIKEYASVSERYEFLTAQRKDILEATDALIKIIDDMEKTITARFKESFDAVVVNFESIFRELFGGGHAELRLDDETKPLESGIEIIAQPPGKKLQNINLMSGGEKTMTAIALMFAVLKTKPTPFCILDEVEAALDDANIDRFANYLKNFEGIQFALVTHQKATMEHADVLYGVTMPEQGISKVISLKLGDQFDLD